MLKEYWKDIAGYEGLYQVSDKGNVRSVDRWLNAKGDGKRLWKGVMLKPIKRSDDYLYVGLSRNSVLKPTHVAILVAKAFPQICGEWFEGAQVDHINTDRTDNRAVNIRVCTHLQNCNNELTKRKMSEAKKGENNPWYGKHRSEETKRKISEARKGKFTGEKNPNWGKFGAEHNRSKPVLQYSKDGSRLIKEWDCAADAERVLKINNSCISRCCSGKLKSAGGYEWRYKKEAG